MPLDSQIRYAILRAVAEGQWPSGPVLRAARMHAGLSQRALAARWGGRQCSVANYEAGRFRPGGRARGIYLVLFLRLLDEAPVSSSTASAGLER